jgi:hypothetical protein
MAFLKAKKREPLGEAGLMEYAVRALGARMRLATVDEDAHGGSAPRKHCHLIQFASDFAISFEQLR